MRAAEGHAGQRRVARGNHARVRSRIRETRLAGPKAHRRVSGGHIRAARSAASGQGAHRHSPWALAVSSGDYRIIVTLDDGALVILALAAAKPSVRSRRNRWTTVANPTPEHSQ